jgi:predicted enzyme related to lactoylglutathione lyase
VDGDAAVTGKVTPFLWFDSNAEEELEEVDTFSERLSEGGQPGRCVPHTTARRAFTITGIDRSDYMAKDPARAIAFYRDVLGLELQSLAPDDGGGEFELADGSTFGLWVGGDDVMPFQPSNGVLFAVDDLEAAVSALEARGIAIITRLETPVCCMALINDTEGNVITLHKRKTAASRSVA